ncbi:MAG: Fic family protein [Chitinophagaceae bacterium]|nr:Fic family protein [Chitinophagaceae bacterium]
MDWKKHIEIIEQDALPLKRIDSKKKRLDTLRPLPSIAVEKLRNTLAIEWTYHSNGIEGNTLTLPETRAVIEDGITVKGKSFREHLEAVNHYEAIEKVVALAQPGTLLSERIIMDLHAMVLQKIEKEWAGRYRPVGVRITGANFVPPNPLKVPDMMAELVEWTLSNPPGLHPLLLATAFHHRFVYIHPFIDGNGRTVRLCYNLMLMAQGYPPAVILKQDRIKYYEALNKANEGHIDALALMMLQACERSLDIYLSNLEGTAEDYKPISHIAMEEDIPYNEEYIGLLARRGKIDAYKEGKNWYTTREAIEDYRSNRKRMR